MDVDPSDSDAKAKSNTENSSNGGTQKSPDEKSSLENGSKLTVNSSIGNSSTTVITTTAAAAAAAATISTTSSAGNLTKTGDTVTDRITITSSSVNLLTSTTPDNSLLCNVNKSANNSNSNVNSLNVSSAISDANNRSIDMTTPTSVASITDTLTATTASGVSSTTASLSSTPITTPALPVDIKEEINCDSPSPPLPPHAISKQPVSIHYLYPV